MNLSEIQRKINVDALQQAIIAFDEKSEEIAKYGNVCIHNLCVHQYKDSDDFLMDLKEIQAELQQRRIELFYAFLNAYFDYIENFKGAVP
jgi:predicted HTH domain antitoxin